MLLTLLAVLLMPIAPDSAAFIRVRLAADQSLDRATFSVRSGSLFLRDGTSGTLLARIGAGTKMEAELRSTAVRFRWDGGGAIVSHAQLEAAGEPISVAIAAWPSARLYRGRLDVMPENEGESDGLLVVNEINVEDYVASVIPAEYPFPELEGAKAQAVVARTYALRAASVSERPFDLVDNISSQVYPGATSETDVSRRAAFETTGEVLTHDDELIEAVYSASNGGHTAANQTVWRGNPAPYLVARPDPYDTGSRHDHWEVRVRKSRVHAVLSAALDMEVDRVEIAETSAEGRVRTLRISPDPDRVVRGSVFRTVLNRQLGSDAVKSTWFELASTGDSYVLTGRGFGHGVGLSQIGTNNRALEGHTYDRILAFYYGGTTLNDIGTTWTAGPPVAARLPESDETGETEEAGRREAPADDRETVMTPPRRQKPPKIWHNRVGERRIGW